MIDASNFTSVLGNTFINDGLYVADSYQNSVENNTVNGKPLVYLEGASNLIANNGSGQVILVDCENITVENLNLAQTNFAVEFWEASNCTISENNITNNRYGFGILLIYSSNDTISSNNITDSLYGIGIWLESSSNNSISQNNMVNNTEGIVLAYYSSGNSITENNVTGNSDNGIVFIYSSNDTVSGNNITNNVQGLWLRSSSDHNDISGNNIMNNGGGIWLDSSSSNGISANNITNGGRSIDLSSSYNNSISGNNIASTVEEGLFVGSSSGNVISGNNITNSVRGIWFYSSSGNSIFHNRFVGNSIQVMSTDSVNVWDDGYPSGGNYWSDYTGIDSYSGVYQNLTGSDGIGDTSYVIDSNNIDRYPIVPPVVVSPQKLIGDLNGDGKVGLDDLVLLANAYGSKPGDPNWNPNADLAAPFGMISLTDLVTLATHYGQHNP